MKKPRGRPSFFSPERDKVLIEKYHLEWTDLQIAELLGCSMQTVGTARERLGLTTIERGFLWTPEKDMLFDKYYAEGLTDAQIAKELGCSAQTIFNRRHKDGLKGKSRESWTPEQDTILRQFYTSTPIKVLSQLVKHSPSSVYKRAFNLGFSKYTPRKKPNVSISITANWTTGTIHGFKKRWADTALKPAEIAEFVDMEIEDLPAIAEELNLAPRNDCPTQ